LTYLPVVTKQLCGKVLFAAAFSIFQKNTLCCLFPEASCSKTFSIHGSPVHHVALYRTPKKIIFVTLEFLLGTNLLVENMLHYTSIMNWSDGKPWYKLQDRRKIERILHKPTFLWEFFKDNNYSIPGADNCSQAKEILSLCENTSIFKILRFSMHINTYF